MGILENSKKRRAHKERAQPKERQHLGRLEKKKDYKERAIDHQRKQSHLKNLKRKANDRNPDEFFFAMQRQRTNAGVHDSRPRPKESMRNDEALLLKTNDYNYLANRAQAERTKVLKLQSSLHGITQQPSDTAHAERPRKQHMKFLHDEVDDEGADVATTVRNAVPEDHWQNDGTKSHEGTPPVGTKLAKRTAKRYRELQQRQQRYNRLSRLAQSLQQQRALMVRYFETTALVL